MRKTTKGGLVFRGERGDSKGGCSTCQRQWQSPNDETKWEITTSFPTAVSQFVSHSISPRTQNCPNNKQLRVKKKKMHKAQENEATGSRRATFDSWKPLKLYACCELSGLPPPASCLC